VVTNVPSVVSCPHCKETEDWKQDYAEEGDPSVPPNLDFKVKASKKGLEVTEGPTAQPGEFDLPVRAAKAAPAKPPCPACK
jgi:hypothetical protein